MKTTQMTFKSTIFVTGLSVLATTAMPATSANAFERHHSAQKHTKHLSKKQHRKLHKQRNQARRIHKNKDNTGNLIAAGIIGLAIGAIVAGESNRRRSVAPPVTYQPYPNEPYYQSQEGYWEYEPQAQYLPDRVPLNHYQQPTTSGQQPHVITFNESNSLEPWTAGWREWCSNRYRSFNANTGTFRGYDGLDHFCVPK